MSHDPIAEEYVRLALAIGQHLPDYIDAYFGPPEWMEQAEAHGKQPLPELTRRAEALAAAVAAQAGADPQHADFMSRHARAMHASLRRAGGEPMALSEEAELIYDIRPERTDAADLQQVHAELDELLPAGGSLYDRMMHRKRELTIPMDRAKDVLPLLQNRLREAARSRFPLPEEEGVDFVFVSDQPWMAFNRYLGGGRSRVEINTDLPILLTRLVDIAAHEAYPGHHTEFSIKDARLYREAGRLEHCVALLYSPACVVSEGIASSAMSVIMPGESLDEWYAQEILPRVGLHPALARGCSRISELLDLLGNSSENAAFMLHEDGAGRAEVVDYLKQYELLTDEEASKMVDFLSDPSDRAYIFSYGAGQKLLKSLFARKGDVTHWFTRLMTEPVTPSQIRGWMGE